VADQRGGHIEVAVGRDKMSYLVGVNKLGTSGGGKAPCSGEKRKFGSLTRREEGAGRRATLRAGYNITLEGVRPARPLSRGLSPKKKKKKKKKKKTPRERRDMRRGKSEALGRKTAKLVKIKTTGIVK